MIVTLIVFLVIGLQMAHLSQVSGNNENGFLNPFDLSQWSEEILHRQYHHHHHHHHGNRARRTLETEKIYRCGRKLYTDVLSACNGPCEPGTEQDLSKLCCGNQCTFVEIRKACCADKL